LVEGAQESQDVALAKNYNETVKQQHFRLDYLCDLLRDFDLTLI